MTPSEVLDRTSRLDVFRSVEVVNDDDRKHVEDKDEGGLRGESQSENERETVSS